VTIDYWLPGTTILYRETWKGKVWTVRPVRVVQDTPDLIALYLAPNSLWKVPVEPRSRYFGYFQTGEWELMDKTWPYGDTLFLIIPGEAHAVHAMWGKENREFVGYYINLQEPIRRFPLGFDFMDQILDIWVNVDLSWHWKDQDSFERYVQAGRYTKEKARAIRAVGERVIQSIEAKIPPFDGRWADWLPPEEWKIPDLLEGWDKHILEQFPSTKVYL